MDEAIRMAGSMRLLLHNTKNSTSLLSHLEIDSIQLISTAPYTPPEIAKRASYLLGLVRLELEANSQPRVYAPLGKSFFNFPIDFKDWWDQIILVPPNSRYMSRGDLILTCANKDGYAHIDANLPYQYEQLIDNMVFITYNNPDGAKTRFPIRTIHFMCIRQMSFEILNSPQLIEIAQQSPSK